MVLAQEKACVERIKRIATKMAPGLEDLTYEERLKGMQLNTLEKNKKKRLNYNT